MTEPATFSVRIRPLGSTCRVRVSERQNAAWLFEELNAELGSGTCGSMQFSPAGYHQFTVKFSDTLTREALRKALRRMSRVSLSDQPA